MNNDVIEQVRHLAPVVQKTSEIERARQRRKLSGAIVAESTTFACEGVSRRAALVGRVRQRRVQLAGAAAVVAAAGVVIPLSLSGGNAAAPVMKLDSYSLRLPAEYHLTATTNACRPMLMWSPPAGSGSDISTPSYATSDASAANAAGGCITMVLAPPYTPTASQPDPEVVRSDFPHVQVGPYNGLIYSGTLAYSPSSGVNLSGTLLYVEIPLANGQRQDLVVGEQGLSQSQLVALVANGLSVPVGTTTPSTSVVGNSGRSSGVGNSGVS